MRLKSIEEKYLLSKPIEECPSLFLKALDEIGLKNVTVRKHVPPRYLLLQYSPSWVGKVLEIEFLLQETPEGTEVVVKWPYTRELPLKNESPVSFLEFQEEMKKKTDLLINEFRRKIGAKTVPANA
jgi:hypothetical protein